MVDTFFTKRKSSVKLIKIWVIRRGRWAQSHFAPNPKFGFDIILFISVLICAALFMFRDPSFVAEIDKDSPNAMKALIDNDDEAKEKLTILKSNIEERFVS